MTWLHQVVRLGIRCRGRADGDRPVGGGDAGGDALGGLDGDGKGRGVGGTVAIHHERQAQAQAPLFGEGEADQAASVFGHEVDRIRRHLLRGQ